ncbi:MAG TPA: 2-C-methyl-D-erythritol 4-phosphate cytidylyltransferase [Clostridiaceae bacterium]|nr:2-C-methyl-D-erythritol 4-phosphate cytidylyltransferase [Clostridiaceae bacterium]
MKKLPDLFVSSVIVAAGKGTRMNMDINKQYLEICGIPVLARTLQVFEDCRFINEIVLVVNEYEILYCKQNIIDEYGFTKVKTLVAGGLERQDSVYNGLLEVDKSCDIVLIHDGARPFAGEKNIIDSIYAAYEFGASCVAVPVKDTVKRSDKDGFVVETLDRSALWLIQTPQTFKYGLILDAHKKALEDGFIGTDDASLVERLGHKPKLVMGGYDNIKITTREDIPVAEAILNCR